MKNIIIITIIFLAIDVVAQTYVDKPFYQDNADKFELEHFKNSIKLLTVESDRNQAIKIISSIGILHPFDGQLKLDLQYRPMTDMHIVDVGNHKSQFIFLTKNSLLSNANGGRIYIEHKLEQPKLFTGNDLSNLIVGDNAIKLFEDGKETWNKSMVDFDPIDVLYDELSKRFLILTSTSIFSLNAETNKFTKLYSGADLTAMVLYKGDIVVGKSDGVLKINATTHVAENTDTKLPCTSITALENINGSLWFGSSKGAFKLRDDGKYDYYSSKRWLVDDEVVDIKKGPDNSVLILTNTGLSRINFVMMTLEEKANHFQKIQRLRHIRYGFTCGLDLAIPGDVSSGVYGDSDNDGLWTSMYLAGELFRYAVTKDEDA